MVGGHILRAEPVGEMPGHPLGQAAVLTNTSVVRCSATSSARRS